MRLRAQDIFPQMRDLGDYDAIPTPLTYAPLVAALAHEVLASGEDPDPPGGEEGHRYYLLGGGHQPGQNFGVLILARYFDDDPCLGKLESVDEAQDAVAFVQRKVFWSANLLGALTRIRQVLARGEAGHGAAGQQFLTAAQAIGADKVQHILARNWQS